MHGSIINVPGGVALAGESQYMDGGDFHGKCISDPDKCAKGLSVAIQVIHYKSYELCTLVTVNY